MYIAIAFAVLCGICGAAEIPWHLDDFTLAHATPTSDYPEEEVQAVYIDGPTYEGKSTTFFAYYAVPPHAQGEMVPGMVLVHGGGGTAFARWVRLWNARGYAAIAMDNCGQIPQRDAEDKHWLHSPTGGPSGWGGFELSDLSPTEQWPYHAIATVLLSHSFLREQEGVDPDRIGITGISWGGYLTCIAAGVDPRFKLAAPVYGCGFLGDNSAWLDAFASVGKEKADRWLALWDPSVYLPHAKMPMLWVTGTNDFAYPMDSLQKSYHLPTGPRTLAIRLRMPHGHGEAGENPEEIHAFADSILKKKPPLPKLKDQGREGNEAWVRFKPIDAVKSAELLYTKSTGKWQDRLWETAEAKLDGNKATAELPEGTTVYYINLVDAEGRVVSGEHEEINPCASGDTPSASGTASP